MGLPYKGLFTVCILYLYTVAFSRLRWHPFYFNEIHSHYPVVCLLITTLSAIIISAEVYTRHYYCIINGQKQFG